MNISPGSSLPGLGLYDSFNRQLSINNPVILVTLTIIIVFYYLVFNYLGIASGAPAAEAAPSPGIKVIEIVMWALFIFLILVNGLQYFFSLDIRATIKNIFSPVPEIDIDVKDKGDSTEPPVPEIMIEKQVFNIPTQKYTYSDAEALCSAYGASLATYDQIEKNYKRGGEWCNYGWSDGQMIFYPTQPDTYNSLQGIKGHEHDCGRPGINGGYIKNKKARFGVNCYGHKPEITPSEADSLGNDPAYPLTKEEIRFNKKVRKFRNKLANIQISPFKSDQWSQI